MVPLANMAAPFPMYWDAGGGAFGIDNSTIKYKKNVIDLNFNVDQFFKNVRPVEFDWKNSDRNDIGFIAEEVALFDARLVASKEDENGDMSPAAVHYDRVSVYLVEIVKQMRAEIAELKQEIEQLKK